MVELLCASCAVYAGADGTCRVACSSAVSRSCRPKSDVVRVLFAEVARSVRTAISMEDCVDGNEYSLAFGETLDGVAFIADVLILCCRGKLPGAMLNR